MPIVDASEFQLGRYAVARVDRGAQVSLRELAAAPVFHTFFQQSDTFKYTKIVERQVLQMIGEFLEKHNVDLGDHDARQANILDASVHKYGDTNNYGGTINQGPHVHQHSSPEKGN
jgi:hypothetical protein